MILSFLKPPYLNPNPCTDCIPPSFHVNLGWVFRFLFIFHFKLRNRAMAFIKSSMAAVWLSFFLILHLGERWRDQSAYPHPRYFLLRKWFHKSLLATKALLFNAYVCGWNIRGVGEAHRLPGKTGWLGC